MNTSPLGIWPLLPWLPLGVVALAQLCTIALGHYDPRSDDGLPEDIYPFYLVYLSLMIAASTAGAAAILWRNYRGTLTTRYANIATILCWTFQAILWGAWCAAAWSLR